MANRDLMKRGKQNVLFVEQSVHKTNGKRNICAHMCGMARQCELHLGLRSELRSGIIPLFI
jgi:hypothetical protein